MQFLRSRLVKVVVSPSCNRMWVAVAFFIFLLVVLALLDTRKPKNYPPGPPWLPIFGSALLVHRLRKKTGQLCKAAAILAEEYGPVIGLKVGKDHIIIVHSYEAIKEMLNDDHFSGRPVGDFYDSRTWGVRLGLLLTDSHFWQEQRRFVLRHLREFGFGRGAMGTIIEEEAADLVRAFSKKFESKNSVLVNMKDIFGVSVLNTLWTMMASTRYSPEDKELKKLQGILTELLAHVDMVGAWFSHFPILRYVAPHISGYKMFEQTHIKIWDFLKKEIAKHNKTYQPDVLRDLMDVYIKVLRSDEEKPSSFSEGQLLAVCMDLFIAGSETTSKSLGFGFLYLVLTPDVQKKVQEEIDRVIGRDRSPTLADRAQMPYTEAMVLEAVRMFMGRTFGIPHRAVQDATLCGYSIPKDTMVIPNMNGALMSKQLWHDPDNFRPERFLQNGRIVIPDNYVPFGFGKHRCLGETLAKASIFLFTTSLLQHFNFSVPPGHPQPSTDAVDGVTAAPKPYQALVTQRF